jgi:acyl-CoA thioesterase
VTTKFVSDTSVSELEPGLYEGSVSRDWWIDRGPNGGFLTAMAMRALVASVADDARSPRSLTIHFTSTPDEGALQIATAVERAGRSLTTASARMEQGGSLSALATGAFSLARDSDVEFDDTSAPDVPTPESVQSIEPVEGMPAFAYQWEIRPAIGGFPFTSQPEALTGGWIRAREDQPIDAALVAQLTDAWLPALFTRLDRPNWVSTIDLTIHFRAKLPLPADWLLVRFESRLARDGFIEEDGELWTTDGRLIAHSRQLALLQAPSQD